MGWDCKNSLLRLFQVNITDLAKLASQLKQISSALLQQGFVKVFLFLRKQKVLFSQVLLFDLSSFFLKKAKDAGGWHSWFPGQGSNPCGVFACSKLCLKDSIYLSLGPSEALELEVASEFVMSLSQFVSTWECEVTALFFLFRYFPYIQCLEKFHNEKLKRFHVNKN